MKKDQKGYVALIAVLVAGAVGLAVALTLLTGGTDSQRATLATQQSVQARNLAKSCVEEALQQMRNNSSYTGTGSLTLGQGTCAYTVTNTGGNNRTINSSGTVQSTIRKIDAYVTITTLSISITSWQEVS